MSRLSHCLRQAVSRLSHWLGQAVWQLSHWLCRGSSVLPLQVEVGERVYEVDHIVSALPSQSERVIYACLLLLCPSFLAHFLFFFSLPCSPFLSLPHPLLSFTRCLYDYAFHPPSPLPPSRAQFLHPSFSPPTLHSRTSWPLFLQYLWVWFV